MVEFILFAFVLVGIALFHNHTLKITVIGLFAIVIYKFAATDLNLIHHFAAESIGLLNLLGLLVGFAVLAKHFQASNIPQILPDYLPDNWLGPFYLLVLIFIMSSFLDNIAAAIVGGTIAQAIFKKNHIGFIVAIVAASNAGGSGSVIGDTTTTMMWLSGKSPAELSRAYIGAIPALLVFGIIASLVQDKYCRIQKDAVLGIKIDYKRITVVAMILAGAILTNILFDIPAVGVWFAIGIGSFFVKTDWKEVQHALGGSLFLVCLVLAASLMPVNNLPSPTSFTSFGLGVVSAFFDNIPLTKLALEQGGYDWGLLSYCVGFGGSMMWFGSSAGVAICTIFEEARSAAKWIKLGWHVILAYLVGFACLLLFN